MERLVGTTAIGIRAPIIRQGDDIVSIVVDSVMKAEAHEPFELRDRDVIAVTEAVVARAQGNYATVGHIASDIRSKFGASPLGVIFPILSRNRFAICLKGIATGVDKVVLMLSYPSDEVGNSLMDLDTLDRSNVNPWSDVLSETQYRELAGNYQHPYTSVDYVAYYKELITHAGCEAEIIFANDPRTILDYTKRVLCCDIHTRKRTQRLLEAAGAAQTLGLDDVLDAPVDGSGYNEAYGLLGSNKATEETVKLFPRDCDTVVRKIQRRILERTGKQVEVMIYGDGAYKDPVAKIWELADPVVSPGSTDGLEGKPNEIKLKYLADTEFAHLRGEALREAIVNTIYDKEKDLAGKMVSQGTTPRHLPDLIGSLADLISGSGDKGTPIVLIQGYFDNYAT